jgi:two-component system CheB/CheR fusion protein
MQSGEGVSSPRVTVAGIGSSAGGLDALRQFFSAVPVDLGIAYVVIVHLSPDHESELASILGRSTKMDVVEVKDSKVLDLKPNCVYVISPDRKLEIKKRRVGR